MSTGFAVKQDLRVAVGHNSVSDQANLQARCLCFGVFQLDLQNQQLFKDGLQVKVQGKVYQALVTLIEAPGEIVTRDALRTRLWPRDTHLNYDANVNTTVNKLRQVLGDTNEESKYIETIPRKGYSFVAKVDYVDGPATTSHSKIVGAQDAEASRWNFLRTPQFLSSSPARIWFTASVIAWVVAAVLFGAAVTLYTHRSVGHEMPAHSAGQDTHRNSKP
jgi:DNA-binding winged helix-turn-helix (wHTH) protein